MVREIIWTITAYKDLQNIVEFIAEDSPYYAMSFYEDVMNKAQTLKEFPLRGRIVPETDDLNRREIFIHRYRIIYKIQNENVIISTIIHGARDYKG
jgi:toxin ParE1/3/4